MIKSEKQAIIERLQERLRDSSAAICVEFRGVNVEKITRFRRDLQQAAGEYQVVKNTQRNVLCMIRAFRLSKHC